MPTRVQHDQTSEQAGNCVVSGAVIMLGNMVRAAGDRSISLVVLRLARAGMRPANCHACEVLAATASATALFFHLRLAAVALFLTHGFFDYLDGALRRYDSSLAADNPTHAERSHAVADKIAEIALFLGIALGQYTAWWLPIAAVLTSMVVTCVGFVMLVAVSVPRSFALFDRTDRMLVLLAFLAVSPSPALLYLIIGMNCATIIWRLSTPLVRTAIVPQPVAKGP